ncbi:hypothetical protein KI387_003566 [Taxus chinensis]|uniref:F-box/kelch-repeat protein n=1 Tax=Taxus chinensis TaxID=29808 RepID=A0AA38LN75_TAXCH|nr:hypothetical protein KI387_003566 [Taxus chinensis]
MGCCNSTRRRPGRHNGVESVGNLFENENDGDGDGNAVKEAEGEELELIASPSVICRSSPFLFMSALWRWLCYAFNIWDDWVFAKLVGRDGEHKFYALNIEANMCLPFPYLKDGPVEGSAMAIVDRKLYVIGGVLRDGVVSNCAYVCDLVNLRGWTPVASMTSPRRNAVAIAMVNDWLLVFGGCQESSTAPLVELFDPDRQHWSSLPVDGSHPARGLDPPFQFVVGKGFAYVRNAGRGIVFDYTNLAWTINSSEVAEGTRVHQGLFQHWCMDCNAAAAGPDLELLITCYVETRSRGIYQDQDQDQDQEEAVYSVRAYDPRTRSWLTIGGLPQIIQENAQRCQFMSLDHRGMQGIGLMLDGDLTILTFDLMNGTPNADEEITELVVRTYSWCRPRPHIKKKWLLQT